MYRRYGSRTMQEQLSRKPKPRSGSFAEKIGEICESILGMRDVMAVLGFILLLQL
jgi:hypothetical protein